MNHAYLLVYAVGDLIFIGRQVVLNTSLETE